MTKRAASQRAGASRRRGVSFDQVRAIALALPGMVATPSYGTPGFKVRGRFVARLREDGLTLAIRMDFPERDARIHQDPDAFFVTDHYLNHPAVVVRLERVRAADLAEVFDAAWRAVAPKKLVATRPKPAAEDEE